MKANKDFLDLESDSSIDPNQKINLNSNLNIQQIENKNNTSTINLKDQTKKGEQNLNNNPNQKGGFLKSVKNFFKLEEESDANPDANNPNNNLSKISDSDLETNNNPADSKIKRCKQKILKTIEENLEVEKSYKTFSIMIFIGLGMLCLSLLFLPVIIFSPSKFVMCFSLGSMIILSSFIFIYGTKSYVEKLFAKNRFAFTILFLVSIILGLYFSISGNYLISIFLAVFQLITLVVFTLTFFPGGSAGISFIGNLLLSPFRNVWSRLTGQGA